MQLFLEIRIFYRESYYGVCRMDRMKIIGLLAFFVAIGMLIMLFLHNDFVGIIIIALLLFIGYNCYDSC
mgnify:CR=1 FL=1